MARRAIEHLRRHAVAYLALFFALSGSAYALSRGEVKARHLAKGAVKTAKLADGAVRSAKLATGAVTEPKLAGDVLGPEDWIEVGGGDGAPGFHQGNSCWWRNLGSGHSSASFGRDPAGFVHLKGVVQAYPGGFFECGQGGWDGIPDMRLIVELPEGYRPEHHSIFGAIANGNVARVRVAQDGGVYVDPPTTAADALAWVSLDGVTFRCAPSGVSGCP